MKILNLYAGIGGNRKLWGNEHEITAVEYDPPTAEFYQKLFPNDKVIIADAHQFLLDNFKNYDFIWSSPPCPTHSDIRITQKTQPNFKFKYADMRLYEEIILLQNFASIEQKWVIENVIPYYEPLILPTKKIHRHFYWSNFKIKDFYENDKRKHRKIKGFDTVYGFDVTQSNIKDKRKALRNLVNPDLGLHLLNCALEMSETERANQLLFNI